MRRRGHHMHLKESRSHEDPPDRSVSVHHQVLITPSESYPLPCALCDAMMSYRRSRMHVHHFPAREQIRIALAVCKPPCSARSETWPLHPNRLQQKLRWFYDALRMRKRTIQSHFHASPAAFACSRSPRSKM